MLHPPYEDPALLRRIQVALTGALKEFDRVCRELDIPYVVYGGTAIGAVRHQGFIPWDDDADVCLPRADYERFLREAPALLHEDYSLENLRTHPDYPSPFTNLGIVGTVFVPEFYRGLSYPRKLSLDIFPLDNMADDPRAYRAQSRATWLWGRLIILRATPRPYVAFGGAKRAVVHAVSAVAHWGMRLLRITPQFLQRRWEGAARRYEHQETRRMADFADMDPAAWSASRDELFPARDVPFEDITVRLAKDADAILRRGYGDYMQLPPEDHRKNHLPYQVSLGD